MLMVTLVNKKTSKYCIVFCSYVTFSEDMKEIGCMKTSNERNEFYSLEKYELYYIERI